MKKALYILALMASSCDMTVRPQAPVKPTMPEVPGALRLIESLSSYSIHPESDYAGFELKPGVVMRRYCLESDRGKTVIIQFHDASGPIYGHGVAKLSRASGSNFLDSSCAGKFSCEASGIFNPNATRGSLALRMPSSGDFPLFMIEGKSGQDVVGGHQDEAPVTVEPVAQAGDAVYLGPVAIEPAVMVQ